MFHIFRWRRERRNAAAAPLDLPIEQEPKKSHSRRSRLRVYHGAQSL